jgi:hypothetical protein
VVARIRERFEIQLVRLQGMTVASSVRLLVGSDIT